MGCVFGLVGPCRLRHRHAVGPTQSDSLGAQKNIAVDNLLQKMEFVNRHKNHRYSTIPILTAYADRIRDDRAIPTTSGRL